MTVSGASPVIRSESVTLFRLFCGGRFQVPWHQRRYDWKPEHVGELLHDIDEAINADRGCYFLGTVILVKSGDRQWLINDGQQRMVTLSLICARLRTLFTDHGDALLEHLSLRVLFDVDEDRTDVLEAIDQQTPRMTSPRDDKTLYNQIIRGRKIGTNGKLTQAWHEIDAFVAGMGLERSRNFFNFIRTKLELACLYIPDSVDPNSVYETINCRGKRLDDVDLIRNHLYSYFNPENETSRRETVHDGLESIFTRLRNNSRFTDYARCYFQSRYGFLQKSNFYRETRQNIQLNAGKSEQQGKTRSDYVFSLTEDFSDREKLALFRAIADANRSDQFVTAFIKSSGHATTKRNAFTFLKELHTYKVTHPLLFALFARYVKEIDNQGRRRLAKWIHVRMAHITSFVMRTALVAPKFEPSHFESDFSNLAELVISTKAVREVDIDGRLKDCDRHGVLNNKKFKARMGEMEMRDERKAKRLLFSINHYVQTDSDLINERDCTVEHVLPQSEHHWDGWYGFGDENKDDWIHRIGNLTLLGRRDNKSGDAGNRYFLAKKDIYSKSAIKITREIANYGNWSPREIEKRQRQLADRAVQVWSFNIDNG